MPIPEYLQPYIVDMASNEKINQLSAKGMCLLMAIFAEEEGNENQPVIAGSIASLMHVVGLIDASVPGTELAVIFSPEIETEQSWHRIMGKRKYAREFSFFHKTTLHFKKHTDQIVVTHLDGISCNQNYFNIPNQIILHALQENARVHNRPASTLVSYEPAYPEDEQHPERVFNGHTYVTVLPTFLRQENNYICGVYAIKDSRFFTRPFIPALLSPTYRIETEFGVYTSQSFTVPPSIIRSTQSLLTREFVSSNYAPDTTVDRKGTSLFAFHAKYPSSTDYIDKFARKYLLKVQACVESKSIAEIESMGSKYDGANLTLSDLEKINSQRSRQAIAL